MKKHRLIDKFFLAIGVVSIASVAFLVVYDRHENVAVRTEASQPDQHKTPSVGALLAGLEARLSKDPDDAKGWLLLARSHDHLGDSASAWSAYTRARELGMTDEALEIKLAGNMIGALDE